MYTVYITLVGRTKISVLCTLRYTKVYIRCSRDIHKIDKAIEKRYTYLAWAWVIANVSFLRMLLAEQVSIDDEGCE